VEDATSSSVSREFEAVVLSPLAVVRSEEAAPEVLEDRLLSAVDTAEEERPTSGSAGKEAASKSPAAPSSLPAAWSRTIRVDLQDANTHLRFLLPYIHCGIDTETY